MFEDEIRLAYHIIRDIELSNLTEKHYSYYTPFDLKAFCSNNNLNPSDINQADFHAICDKQSSLEINETLYITHFYSNE